VSKREQILSAIVAQLAGTTGVGTRIFRSREDALASTEAPSIIVMPDGEDILSDGVIGPIDKHLAVKISVYARGVQPDSAADPVVESAYTKIMADPSIGGLAIDVIENGTVWEFDQADHLAVMVGTRFLVWYRHNRDDLGV
jgi:hypothetical protein